MYESGGTSDTDDEGRLAEVERALADVPKQTQAVSGLAGDPVNFAFVGTLQQLGDSLIKVGWSRAREGMDANLHYGVASVLHQVDREAPVSDLLLRGRKQDAAFELAESISQRHHLRVWQVGMLSFGPLYAGAASHDIAVILKPNYLDGVGSSVVHHSLSPGIFLPTTHQIDYKVDEERDKVAQDLKAAGNTILGSIHGYDQTYGQNGDGIPFTTDGRLTIIVAAQ